jgi:predicted protein tyrosine phosphatase
LQITVTDRETIERGLVIRAGTYAVISVRDPDKRRVRIPKAAGLRGKLELAFHDTEPIGGMKPPPELTLMTEDQAGQIVQFVLQHHHNVNALLIHCEQGMSRSPAIAAAIARTLDLDSHAFETEYQPNQHVKALVLDAFQNEFARRNR